VNWLNELERLAKEALLDPPLPLRDCEQISAALPDGQDVLYSAEGFEEYLSLAVGLINVAPRLLAIVRAAQECQRICAADIEEQHRYHELDEALLKLFAALEGK